MVPHQNKFPKLHNAAWPGVVGKGEGSEPPIGLDTMLDLTAAAEVGQDHHHKMGCEPNVFVAHILIDVDQYQYPRSEYSKCDIDPIRDEVRGVPALEQVHYQGDLREEE